jgi:hypothetical protein
MYTALDLQSGATIVILSRAWNGKIAELRALAAQNRLVCPGCRQALRVRSGRFRRRHFAHMHLVGCAFGSASPAALEGRALLFGWLESCFSRQMPPAQVCIEQALPGNLLPRPIDCWVERSSTAEASLAYWIIDARMQFETRQSILSGLRLPGVSVNWLLIATLLQPDPHDPQTLVRLSPTERDFLIESPFDQVGAEQRAFSATFGRSLHYLDCEKGLLISYRSLILVHAPNIFRGRRLETPLASLQIDLQTGEFVHPGETDALAYSQAQIANRQQREKEAALRLEAYLSRRRAQPAHDQPGFQHPRWQDAAPSLQNRGEQAKPPASQPLADAGLTPFQGHGLTEKSAYLCVVCGRLTEDWWTTFLVDGERKCRCRACLKTS